MFDDQWARDEMEKTKQLFAKAGSFYDQKDFDNAIRVFTELLRQAPMPTAFFNRGQAYMEKAKLELFENNIDFETAEDVMVLAIKDFTEAVKAEQSTSKPDFRFISDCYEERARVHMLIAGETGDLSFIHNAIPDLNTAIKYNKDNCENNSNFGKI